MIRSIIVGSLVFVVCVGFLVFTAWGFDPATWLPEFRGLAYALVVTLTVGGGAIAYRSGDA